MSANDNHLVSTEIAEKIYNKTKNLQLSVEVKNDTIYYVSVKNNSEKTIELLTQDNQIFIIQEAIDESGKWKPIEYWQYSTCGNSYNSIEILPKNKILTETTRYDGDFKTKIRFKLLHKNKEFYSNEVEAKISLQQFKIPEKLDHHLYRSAKRWDKNNAENIIFLKPKAIKIHAKAEKKYLEDMAKKRKNNLKKQITSSS
ncbi:hypothetical protein GV828_03845 [Flavobacterium sp. NST-5]|uniref:Uncharacterized protein n=1 Tax=Flavobacterium ichthyis TaxID=2698827 RepID=A0ABW9ZC37_9FLAO|nr:hypothetical protein [Flavobacterium ichthyis]NBL64333.1 hypothetical protein [Flavobacterium ichthyis]